MKQESLETYEGKEVKLLLKNGFRYRGLLKTVNDTEIILLDKFSQIVSISLDEISLIIENKENEVKSDVKKKS